MITIEVFVLYLVVWAAITVVLWLCVDFRTYRAKQRIESEKQGILKKLELIQKNIEAENVNFIDKAEIFNAINRVKEL